MGYPTVAPPVYQIQSGAHEVLGGPTYCVTQQSQYESFARIGWVLKAIDAVKQIQKGYSEWVDMDVHQANIHAAVDVWTRLRTTKFEILSYRAIRDSRKKKDHLEKYKTAYEKDVGPITDNVFGPLCTTIFQICSEPDQPAVKDSKPKAPPSTVKTSATGSVGGSTSSKAAKK